MSSAALNAEFRILELARSFPSLRGAPGVRHHWRPNDLDDWAASVASSGEKQTARFVLGVWNRHEEWNCGRFDLFAAVNIWDDAHLVPFQHWAAAPWFC